MTIEFKWPLGIDTGIQVEVTAERVGEDGVNILGFSVLSGADDFSYVAYLLSKESGEIEEHAHEAMQDLEREVERFMTVEDRAYG